MTSVRQLRRRLLRARMEHACDLCGGTIRKGQQYVRIVAMVNGCFGMERHHVATGDAEEDECAKPMRPLIPFWARNDREENENGNEETGRT